MDVGTRLRQPRSVSGAGTQCRRGTPELRLPRRVAAGVDHRGSDVRICTGEVLRPSAWTQREIAARLWLWKTIMSAQWTKLQAGECQNQAGGSGFDGLVVARRRIRGCLLKRSIHSQHLTSICRSIPSLG